MVAIRTLHVNSLGQLIDTVAESADAHDGPTWFRGHMRAEWEILPSIWRIADRTRERQVVHQFRARAQHRMTHPIPFGSHPEWLSTMQHYGLPTRLLDWSTSPLVATYFALAYLLDNPDAPPFDAAIWLLKPAILNRIERNDPIIFSINSASCIDDLVPVFYPNVPETHVIRAVMASVHDNRIFVQQGAFTIHSRRTPLEQAPHAGGVLTRIILPAAAVGQIARQLKSAGYRRGDIFPDLANLADELRHDLHHAAKLSPPAPPGTTSAVAPARTRRTPR